MNDNVEASMDEGTKKTVDTWIEEIEIAGSQLVERTKELVREGNVRRLIIKKPDGDTLIEIPLTAGVAVGSVVTMLVPVLAALGAMAALLARVKVQVVRDGEPVHEIAVSGTEASGTWKDRAATTGAHSYFLRAVQRSSGDGPDMAWTSPVFVTLENER